MHTRDSVYCPYTDRLLSVDDVSKEHIVPLALGGSDAFVVPVGREFNSKVGSSIDGAMANDFLVAIERTRYDARGHSGKKPTAHVRRAKLGASAKPAQVHISVRDGLRVWDAIERRDLSPAETAGTTIECQLSLDLDVRLRFVAKVALAAGYAIYGDVFKRHVKHHELRGVMNQEKGEGLDRYRDFTTRGDDPLLSAKPEFGTRLQMIRGLCDSTKGSIVMLIPSRTSLTVAVGILGKYVGMLDVDADTKPFPNSGTFNWGHVVVLTQGRVKRCSFAALLEKVASIGQAHVLSAATSSAAKK